MRSRVGWVGRAALALAALGLALYAFGSGAVVSDRPGIAADGWVTHLYYAIGLFVLGGLDLGVPIGGPITAQRALWAAYFLAPLVTTGVLIESALRLLKPGWLQRKTLRDHIVVVGQGRLGEFFLEGIYAVEKRPKVLLVDTRESLRLLSAARTKFGAPYLTADIRDSATLDLLSLRRARGVVLLTRDDLVNLEAAWAILEARPGLPVVAHVADIQLKREVDLMMGDDGGQRVRSFNSHHMAAVGLYDRHLTPRFRETASRDVVVIAGFGRFGQTMFEHLRTEAMTEIERVVIVDRAATSVVATFNEQTDSASFPVDVIDGDIGDVAVWNAAEQVIGHTDDAPLYILGTDVDTVNFRAAMLLRKRSEDAEIFVRCFRGSRFSTQIASHYRLHVMALERMMRRTLAEQQQDWFS